MNGELWQECPECGDEPVCVECMLCAAHCTCETHARAPRIAATPPREQTQRDNHVLDYARITTTPVTLDGIPAMIVGWAEGEHQPYGATVLCASDTVFRYAQYSWSTVRTVIDEESGRFRYNDAPSHWEYHDQDRSIHVLNATPMMADVVSGAVERPREQATDEPALDWVRQTPAWKQLEKSMNLIDLTTMPGWLQDDRERLTRALDDYEHAPVIVLARDNRAHRHAIAFNIDGTRAAVCDHP